MGTKTRAAQIFLGPAASDPGSMAHAQRFAPPTESRTSTGPPYIYNIETGKWGGVPGWEGEASMGPGMRLLGTANRGQPPFRPRNFSGSNWFGSHCVPPVAESRTREMRRFVQHTGVVRRLAQHPRPLLAKSSPCCCKRLSTSTAAGGTQTPGEFCVDLVKTHDFDSYLLGLLLPVESR